MLEGWLQLDLGQDVYMIFEDRTAKQILASATPVLLDTRALK